MWIDRESFLPLKVKWYQATCNHLMTEAVDLRTNTLFPFDTFHFRASRGAFRTHYHFAMLLLVGGIFGPTGSAIMELASASGGSFLFAYFLIYFAFTALFPANALWIRSTTAERMGRFARTSLLRDPGTMPMTGGRLGNRSFSGFGSRWRGSESNSGWPTNVAWIP